MTTRTRHRGLTEVTLTLHENVAYAAHGTVIAIHHQGDRVVLLLDSGDYIGLSLAEARRVVEQTRRNISGWVATCHGSTLVLEEVTA